MFEVTLLAGVWGGGGGVLARLGMRPVIVH